MMPSQSWATKVQVALHAAAQLVAEIDVETDQLAGGVRSSSRAARKPSVAMVTFSRFLREGWRQPHRGGEGKGGKASMSFFICVSSGKGMRGVPPARRRRVSVDGGSDGVAGQSACRSFSSHGRRALSGGAPER